MKHRHLNHQGFTLAAIDDVIERGDLLDWASLRAAALRDTAIRDGIRKACKARVSDPYAQRYHFWMHYAEERLT